MSNWDKDFYRRHRAFQMLYPEPFAAFEQHQWPAVHCYNDYCERAKSTICNANNRTIEFITQRRKHKSFDKQYEPQIFLDGKVLTREQNWHDFFNMLVWKNYPRSKACINRLQYHALNERRQIASKRSPLENMLTLFDENGIVIVSSDPVILNDIKNHHWKTVFWDKREKIRSHTSVFIFGHALYEKLLDPYIGMSGGSLLFTVSQDFHAQAPHKQMQQIDNIIAQYLSDHTAELSPRNLQPFPLLGYPGFDDNNEKESYYENTNYFRPKRIKSIKKI